MRHDAFPAPISRPAPQRRAADATPRDDRADPLAAALDRQTRRRRLRRCAAALAALALTAGVVAYVEWRLAAAAQAAPIILILDVDP